MEFKEHVDKEEKEDNDWSEGQSDWKVQVCSIFRRENWNEVFYEGVYTFL